MHQCLMVLLVFCSSGVSVTAIKSKSRNAFENEDPNSVDIAQTQKGARENWARVRENVGMQDNEGKTGRVLREQILERAKQISDSPCVEDPKLANLKACGSPEEQMDAWPQGETRKGLRPPWTLHLIQRPKGKREMGTWCAWCYTQEQQKCLGITEQGYCPGDQSIWPDFVNGRPSCSTTVSAVVHHPTRDSHDVEVHKPRPLEKIANPGEVAVAEKTTLDLVAGARRLVSNASHLIGFLNVSEEAQSSNSHSRRPRKRASQPGVKANATPNAYMEAIQVRDHHMQQFFNWYDRDDTVTIEFPEALSLVQELRDSYAIPYHLQYKLRTSLLSFDKDSDKRDDLDFDEFGKFTEAVLGGRLPDIFES